MCIVDCIQSLVIWKIHKWDTSSIYICSFSPYKRDWIKEQFFFVILYNVQLISFQALFFFYLVHNSNINIARIHAKPSVAPLCFYSMVFYTLLVKSSIANEANSFVNTYLKLFAEKYWILLSASFSESSCSPWNVSSSIHCKLFFDISTILMEFCRISIKREKKIVLKMENVLLRGWNAF